MEYSRYTKNNLSLLPSGPGIYKFYTKDNILIYVGKANNIKKRVKSYFAKQKKISPKTIKMVSQIYDIEFTIVNSEHEALLLESSIIKNNNPKYNILLRDDKSYPYICIMNERFPRILSTRQVTENSGEYFGPYPDLSTMNNILELIKDTFTLRTCKFNLSQKNIDNKKIKVCLEYHIKNCKAPCERLQTQENYDNDISQIRNLLKGNFQEVRKNLNLKMLEYAKKLQFEKAHHTKEKISAIDKYYAKSLIISPKNEKDIDVFAITTDSCNLNTKLSNIKHNLHTPNIISKNIHTDKMSQNEHITDDFITQTTSNKKNETITDNLTTQTPSNFKKIFISYIKIQRGRVVFTKNMELSRNLEESLKEILILAIVHLRSEYSSAAKEIITNVDIIDSSDLKYISDDENIKVVFPQKGDKRKLVELAIKNALNAKKDAITKQKTLENKKYSLLNQLMIDLGLRSIPRHIECFDNSNILGTNPVSAMVCFKDGMKYASGYRKYNIKTVKGPNDYASMEEVISRRYDDKNSKKKKLDSPNLIIIDGGKGQLNSAIKALKKLKLDDKIEVRSIAKKLEEIYKPRDPFPLLLCKTSPSLKFIQKIRNEAHRFAITFHKHKRLKSGLKSEMDAIKGIGTKTIHMLLNKLGSVKNIKEASLQQLTDTVGKHKAQIILKYFRNINA